MTIPDFVPVLRLEELPHDGFKAVEVEGRSILVGRIGNQLFAWLDRCPHAGAPLRIGKRCGEELTCAWHGWTFNLLTGSAVPDPAFHLTSIPVKIDGSQVFVSV
ncbi:MAG: Rieske (2Fe-2S) protein [Candidatus Omnitrophica bacterium]|nr:Rieske (2Fe-2S) protein [Candidatus Omnitrophota bacterium]